MYNSIESFNVFAAGSMTLAVTSVSPASVNPAGIVSINIQITNTGLVALDPVSITSNYATPQAGGSNIVLPDSFLTGQTVAVGETKLFTANVTLPANVLAGAYTATLTTTETDLVANTDSRPYSFTVL